MSMFSLKKLALVAFVGAGMTLSGCLTNDDKDEKPPVDSSKALPADTTVSVGAQGHASLGSAVDLDTRKVLLSSAANSALETVDLVFLFYTGKFYIHNTTSAKAAGTANSINLTNSYPDAKLSTNDFVKVTTKPASQEAAMTAFATSTSKLSSSAIAAGDMFIVETTEGDLVFLTIASLSGTDNKGVTDLKFSVTPF